eukprot:GAHX01002085.1.p1 GENE.GAHX01002085.1~~GAHX01002085.1.p1  ORF type:complete len:454 (-),score=86.88 GAHX01002085.1:127-1488(-)
MGSKTLPEQRLITVVPREVTKQDLVHIYKPDYTDLEKHLNSKCFLCQTTVSTIYNLIHCEEHHLSFHNHCVSKVTNFYSNKCLLCFITTKPSPIHISYNTKIQPKFSVSLAFKSLVSKFNELTTTKSFKDVKHIKESSLECLVLNCKEQPFSLFPQNNRQQIMFFCETHFKENKELFKKLNCIQTIKEITEDTKHGNILLQPFKFSPFALKKFIPIYNVSNFPAPYLTYQIRNQKQNRILSFEKSGLSTMIEKKPSTNYEVTLIGAAGKFISLKNKKVKADLIKAVTEDYVHPGVVVGLITNKANPSYGIEGLNCGTFAGCNFDSKIYVLGEYKGIVQTKKEHLKENGAEDGYFFGIKENPGAFGASVKDDFVGVNALRARSTAVYANDWRNFKSKRKRNQNTLCVEVKVNDTHHIVWITAGRKIAKYSELLTDYGEEYWSVHEEYLQNSKTK